jgi:hypothetical protein
VSWDFHNAAKHGFTLLQQQVEKLTIKRMGGYSYGLEYGLRYLPTADGWSWQQWADLLSDPLSYKLPDLKEAAKQLHMIRSGTKAELVLRLLGAFGLKAPSKAPPRVLRAIALERICLRPWRGMDPLLGPLHVIRHHYKLYDQKGLPRAVQQQHIAAATGGITKQQLAAAINAAAWRRLLMLFGFESEEQLLELMERVRRHGQMVSAMSRKVAAVEEQHGDAPAGDMQSEAPHSAAASEQRGAAAFEMQGQVAQEAAQPCTAAAAQQGEATAAEVQRRPAQEAAAAESAAAAAESAAAAAATQHRGATEMEVQGQVAEQAAAPAAAAQHEGSAVAEVQL